MAELKLCLVPAQQVAEEQIDASPGDSPQARAVEVFQRMLDEVPHEQLEEYASAIERALPQAIATQQSQSAAALAGYELDDEESFELEVRALKAGFQRRASVLASTLPTGEVGQLLGRSRQTPHDRVKARSLVAVRAGGALHFPIWQFDSEGPDGVITGFPETLRALGLQGFVAVRWFMRLSPVLDGRTPVEALKDGDTERVLDFARGVVRV